MFQRLTSLFFSDSNTPEGLEEPKPFVEEEEEEGWLVIDLAEEPGPAGVGSSPMEDLLIEHPSMSVYVTSSLEVDGEGPEDDAAGEPAARRPERHGPQHSRALQLKAAVLEKLGQARRAQRARQRAERPRLSPAALQRQNRARQRPPRRARQPGPVLHQPCRRHCGY
ncbi:tumor protein p53-inducible nuclear protein 2 [Colius striatus]|uniref:tumor protein p53-inducible nuclear protein 2 n=1 Tax=Colius striatus TaxID=57412 RepID=UPI002B1E137C|nr:tumor protein p53-inducible nuclear protein 2 [Colius striatus]